MSLHFDRGLALYGAAKYEHAARELRKALEHSPEDAETHAMLSFTLCEIHNLQEAAEEARAAISFNPLLYRGFHALALALKLDNKFTEAETAIREAIRLEPEYSSLHSLYSNILYSQMRFNEALKSAEQACRLNPSNASALRTRADALLALERIPEARDCIRAALDLDPMSVSGHIASGRQALINEDYAEAIEECREALRLSPNDDNAHYSLACALTHSGQHEEAHTHILESIRLNSKDVWSQCLFAEILEAEGHHDEAIKAAERALEIAPDHFKPHATLAYLYHRRARLAEAETEARKALELKPEHYPNTRSLVNVLMARHKKDEAQKEVESFLQKFPSAEAYALLLMCLAHSKQIERYREIVESGLALDPNNALLLETAASAFFHAANYEDSYRFAERLIEIRPGPMQAVHIRILSLIRLKRYDEAFASLEDAIEAGKDLPSLYVNRGILYHELGKIKEAAADLAKALELDPANKTARNNLLLILNCKNPIYSSLCKIRSKFAEYITPIYPSSASLPVKVVKIILLPFVCALALIWLISDSLLSLCNAPFLMLNPLGRRVLSGKYLAAHFFVLLFCLVPIIVTTKFGLVMMHTAIKVAISVLSVFLLAYFRGLAAPSARPRVGCAAFFLLIVFNVWLWTGV